MKRFLASLLLIVLFCFSAWAGPQVSGGGVGSVGPGTGDFLANGSVPMTGNLVMGAHTITFGGTAISANGISLITAANYAAMKALLGYPTSGEYAVPNANTTGSATFWKGAGTGKAHLIGPGTGTDRAYTFPDADATILYAAGTLGSWTFGSGTVGSGDTYLAALQKIDGNVAGKQSTISFGTGGRTALGNAVNASGGFTTYGTDVPLVANVKTYMGGDVQSVNETSEAATCNWANGSTCVVTAEANTTAWTLTMSNPVAGQVYRVYILQQTSGPVPLPIFSPTVRWVAGAPTFSGTNGNYNAFTLQYIGTTYFAGHYRLELLGDNHETPYKMPLLVPVHLPPFVGSYPVSALGWNRYASEHEAVYCKRNRLC